jgi:hypothetical protein
MREIMVKNEMIADNPLKKHFTVSLPIIEIALRLAHASF